MSGLTIDHDEQITALCLKWGWATPPNEIRTIAATALKCMTMQSGQCLTYLGLIQHDRLEAMLYKKPDGVKTLEWVALQDPSVRPAIDKVLVLRSGYAYYDTLRALAIHPAMSDIEVQKRADYLDAVLMQTVNHKPVVVFSTWAGLVKFVSAGREDRSNDALRVALSTVDILVAVGRQDEVISALALSKAADAPDPIGDGESIWYGASAIDKHQKQLVRILDYALANKVTDIWFSPSRDGRSSVFMRRYGNLIPVSVAPTLLPEETVQITRFLMAKSGANPGGARVREPRDGQLTYRSGAGDAFSRLSFIPLSHPNSTQELISISIRLFSRTEASIRLADLRLSEAVIKHISLAVKLSQGLILVCGPTNTGKSTTIAGALGEHAAHFGDKRKRLSIENPVERFLPGIAQINVPEYLDNGFAQIMRSILRHDPDALWIGEVRDSISADVCVAAAISGHLVFSTIHATDTIVGYDILSKKVSSDYRFQLIEALSLIVAQRLLPEACPHCSTLAAPTLEQVEDFETYLVRQTGIAVTLPELVVMVSPDGCERCQHTGYVGMLPINEVLVATRAVKDAMLSMTGMRDGATGRKAIADSRTVTLFESAMLYVSSGQVALEDALI